MVNKEEKVKKGFFRKKKREKNEFEQKVIDIARVTRVVKGGKRFSFRTAIVIGDKKGRVGVGIAKGPDMKASTEKSYAQAKKNLIQISFKGNTIPYMVKYKTGSAVILLKPASPGTGIVAGGAVRSVIALAGISDITAKMLGSRNKLNNARATINALQVFNNKTVGELKVQERRKRAIESKKEKEAAIKNSKKDSLVKKVDNDKMTTKTVKAKVVKKKAVAKKSDL